MTEACRQLPEPHGDYVIDDYLTNLMATVLDFQTHTTAVRQALDHFATWVRPNLADVENLVALMGRWPDDEPGNTALAQHLWGYRQWTRAHLLRQLVAYFASIGVNDQPSLRRWAATAEFTRDFQGRVKGLGPAVFQWLVMRQGVDTVKPDVHVHRFASRVLGRRLSDDDVVAVVVAAARRLGRSAHRLDWAIWETSRAAGGPDAPPSRPSRPPVADPPPPAPWSVLGSTGGAGAVSFIDDDAGYLVWIAAHPGGYVLNHERKPSGRYLVLHRATCYTTAPRDAGDPRTWTIAYAKTCAASTADLDAWAATIAAARPKRCGVCRPPD